MHDDELCLSVPGDAQLMLLLSTTHSFSHSTPDKNETNGKKLNYPIPNTFIACEWYELFDRVASNKHTQTVDTAVEYKHDVYLLERSKCNV